MLYLVPNLLSPTEDLSFISERTRNKLQHIKVVFCETEKAARKGIRNLGIMPPYDDIDFYLVSKKTTHQEYIKYIKILKNLNNQDALIISDAGVPCVADPGSRLIFECHQSQIKVSLLDEHSAIIHAVATSGLNGQNFCFKGYLPEKHLEAVKSLRNLENLVLETKQSLFFIETPYRNLRMLENLSKALSTEVYIYIGSGFNSEQEYIRLTQSNKMNTILADFKRFEIEKQPTIYGIGTPFLTKI